ncbi:MAG TPA: ABC transporter permease [Acidimicrobiales bacterium]|nr:ABC transporter permease [Acidimicrobiales bacterium]
MSLTAPRAAGPTAGFELHGARTTVPLLLRDVWRSRDLLATLARKDFFVRFRRTSFGLLWAVGLPLVQATVLAIVFTKIVRIDTGGNYGIYVFSGMLPWTFLSGTVTTGSTSIVDGAQLATKIYFPRAVLPLVTLGANLYGFLPGVAVLLLGTAAIGEGLGADVVLLVPATLLMVAFVASLTLLLAGLHVYFRDLRFIVQATTLAWFYGTPVIYPLDEATGLLRTVLLANPATGMVTLFRAAVSDTGTSGLGTALLATVGWTAVLGTVALLLHARRDRVFVDLL